jgi:hypothetical protein
VSTSAPPPARDPLPPIAAKIEAELERRARLDSRTWTEFERALFAWYEATKP